MTLTRLDELESQAIYILREAYANFNNLAMLWSIGKDSTVMLHLARKAFMGNVPFPLVHIDTGFQIEEMIEYRDYLAREWGLNIIYGKNVEALQKKETYPDGALTHIQCCGALKTQTLRQTLDGTGTRFRFNHEKNKYEPDSNTAPYQAVIVGARADEEGSRSKERYFSPRNKNNDWDVDDQPPELWSQFKTDFQPGTHLRVHPILDWTELDLWEYIDREEIKLVSLYFDQGDGKRYRSLGCYPCTSPINSNAKTTKDIIQELRSGKLKNVAERSGRAQDKEGGGGLEELRRDGYM